MKHLFVVAVATGIFTGTSFEAKAQANINLEKLNGSSPRSGASPKFISNIEITPDRIVSEDEQPLTGSLTVVTREEKVVSMPGSENNLHAAASIENCSSLQFKYAMLMETEVENISNTELYNFVDDWWATRYRYGGTGRTGIDCSAFTGKLLLDVFNTTVPRTARDQFQVCDMVANEDLQEGDLVFFNTRGGISHVGVYLGNNYFVHSSTHSGVTINSLTEDYYRKKFLGGGRVKK